MNKICTKNNKLTLDANFGTFNTIKKSNYYYSRLNLKLHTICLQL